VKFVVGEMTFKKIVITAFLTIAMIMALQMPYDAENMPEPPKKSREEWYHDMFLSLLLDDINKAVDDHYSKLLTENPVIYPYLVDVVKAERVGQYRSFEFLVTLEVIPVVGSHISVGMDRLTFYISTGEVTLKRYEHLKTHELPPTLAAHYQNTLK
jgi:hypothetical protein